VHCDKIFTEDCRSFIIRFRNKLFRRLTIRSESDIHPVSTIPQHFQLFKAVEFDCSKSDCPYHTILQTRTRQSDSTVPNQTTHTTQFSKPLSAEAVEFDCSKSDYPTPHNSPNRCQPRQSNLTVPNQTTPYHTILQTAVSRGMRPLSLHKKRFA